VYLNHAFDIIIFIIIGDSLTYRIIHPVTSLIISKSVINTEDENIK